jgi:siroheme synthase (precorrin-2 oxidase/ferrochelatase)
VSFLRQQSLIDQKRLAKTSVTIVGTGSIGSFTALALTKMGVKRLTLYDKDEVELHNISNQLFPTDSIGKPKAEATLVECQRQSPERDTELIAKNEFYKDQPLDSEIVIASTDNIEGRAAAFATARQNFETNLFIDVRMGGELLRVFNLNPKNVKLVKDYEEKFLKDVKNSEEPCTARTIIYNVLMASSLLSAFVKKYVNGEPLPFHYTFHFTNLDQIIARSE